MRSTRTTTQSTCRGGHDRGHAQPDAAFSLLEMMVVVSVIALMAGVLAPAEVERQIENRLEITGRKLALLRSAVASYFEDTLTAPTSLSNLGTDPGISGWLGPYMVDDEIADPNGNGAYLVDGFGTAITITSSGGIIFITSPGPNRVAGDGDDVVESVTMNAIRRQVTRRKLDVVNAAMLGYLNSDGTALTSDIELIRLHLAQAGLMPYGADDSLFRDGWGDLFIPDPNTTPVVRLTSSHLD